MRKILSCILCFLMLLPCTAFGSETDPAPDPDSSGAAIRTESDSALEPVPEDLEDLLVVRNSRGRTTSLQSVDSDDYDGFLCVMKEDTPQEDLQKMEERMEEVNATAEASSGETARKGTGSGEIACAQTGGAADTGNAPGAGAAEPVREVIDGEVYAADSLRTIDAVADADQIDYIEPNYIRQLALLPGEGSANNRNIQNYRLIDIDLLWDYGITGSGVKVAVLDSGTMGLRGGKKKHEDLNYSRITRGNTLAYSNVRTGKRYKKTYGNDDHGHGTFIAGQIGAKKNNRKGVTGMAPSSRIISIKISNRLGLIADSDILKGLRQARSKGAKVINMSLAGMNYSSAINKECKKLSAAGILIIAAAGNLGSSSYQYPASYSSVISVAAVDSTGRRASYSQYNDRIDCAAPGSFYGIGTARKNKYRSMSGTSMAAPVVTAYAAIVKSLKPKCTTSQFRTILKKTCTDQGSSGKDSLYGYGIVNFRSMYRYLTGTTLYPKAGSNIARMLTDFSGSYATYNGAAYTPDISVSYLREGTDYTVEYRDNVKIGTARIILRGIGRYTGTATKTFSIVPRGTSLTSVTGGKGKLSVKWRSQTSHTSGYQLRCVWYNKKNQAKVKTVTISSPDTLSRKVTGLKHKRYYYVWIRTYKTVNGKKYCSPWSDTYRYAYVR